MRGVISRAGKFRIFVAKSFAAASGGQRGTEKPEGLRTPLGRHHLGEQRLAGRLVDLEGEAEQRGPRRPLRRRPRPDGNDEQ